jgi:hypothetical protein
VSELVLVVPLREGARAKARELLEQGPPFDLDQTPFERHQVFLTDSEVVFVFDARGGTATLTLGTEDPSLWTAAAAWRECLAGPVRKAEIAFSWKRPDG